MLSSVPAPDTYSSSPPGHAAVSAASEYLTAARANAPSASGAPQVEGSNRKKPRPSKTKPGQHLSKSPSTPLLRGLVMSDPDSADKKRNKLGYQRISIACAHCRRRKIRCLLAEDDPEQRCQNCIRLKKECVFYPVDQQAALDARSETSGKAGVPSEPSTVSSPPTQLAARSLNNQGHPFGGSFHHATAESPGGYQGIPAAPGGSVASQGNIETPDGNLVWSNHPSGGYAPQEYAYHRENPMPWNPQEYGMHQQAIPVGGHGGMTPTFPRYGSIAGDTAPFPGSMDQHPQSARPSESHTFAYAQEHMQPPWQQQSSQPVRSMSYPADFPGNNSFNPIFPLDQQAHGSYARPQQPDPRLVQVAPGQGPGGPHNPQYMIPHDQRGPNIPVMPGYPQQQQIPSHWYPDPSSFGHHGDEEARDNEYGYPSGRPG